MEESDRIFVFHCYYECHSFVTKFKISGLKGIIILINKCDNWLFNPDLKNMENSTYMCNMYTY